MIQVFPREGVYHGSPCLVVNMGPIWVDLGGDARSMWCKSGINPASACAITTWDDLGRFALRASRHRSMPFSWRRNRCRRARRLRRPSTQPDSRPRPPARTGPRGPIRRRIVACARAMRANDAPRLSGDGPNLERPGITPPLRRSASEEAFRHLLMGGAPSSHPVQPAGHELLEESPNGARLQCFCRSPPTELDKIWRQNSAEFGGSNLTSFGFCPKCCRHCPNSDVGGRRANLTESMLRRVEQFRSVRSVCAETGMVARTLTTPARGQRRHHSSASTTHGSKQRARPLSKD